MSIQNISIVNGSVISFQKVATIALNYNDILNRIAQLEKDRLSFNTQIDIEIADLNDIIQGANNLGLK